MPHCFLETIADFSIVEGFFADRCSVAVGGCDRDLDTPFLEVFPVYISICFGAIWFHGSHIYPCLFSISIGGPLTLALAHGIHGFNMCVGWEESPSLVAGDGLTVEDMGRAVRRLWDIQRVSLVGEQS